MSGRIDICEHGEPRQKCETCQALADLANISLAAQAYCADPLTRDARAESWLALESLIKLALGDATDPRYETRCL